MRTLLLTTLALSLAACSSCDEKKQEDQAAVAPVASPAPANPPVAATQPGPNLMMRPFAPREVQVGPNKKP